MLKHVRFYFLRRADPEHAGMGRPARHLARPVIFGSPASQLFSACTVQPARLTPAKNGPLRSRPSEGEDTSERKPSEGNRRCRTHLTELWHTQQSRQRWVPGGFAFLPTCHSHMASLGVEPAVRLRPLHCRCNPESIRPRAAAFDAFFVCLCRQSAASRDQMEVAATGQTRLNVIKR